MMVCDQSRRNLKKSVDFMESGLIKQLHVVDL